jgi:DUF4097 and DUF4098 domain-containing protein YvlB
VVIRGQSGPIALTNITGDVKIENPYGQIELRNVRGNVDLDTKSARIIADGVVGDWKTDAEFSTFDLRNIRANRLKISNKSGKIEVDLKTVPSVVETRNEYSDVDVELPSGFKGSVDLNASYGSVHTNLPSVKLKKLDNGAGAYAMRMTGDGSAKIEVETKSASIRVNER